MPNYQGVWSLSTQYQAIGDQNWIMAPGAPTGVSAAAGNASATVSFTAPTFEGKPPPITGYRVTSDPEGLTATGSSSPITVSGLTNGTAYTFIVQATNSVDYGTRSDASGGVTPAITPIGLFSGGETGGSTTNRINKIIISTTGNATDFGDLINSPSFPAACGSTTTGLIAGGSPTINVIQSITFATEGNASDFGDLTVGRVALCSFSSTTRGVFSGGSVSNTYSNVIDYVTIASAGNASDFGDLSQNGGGYGPSGFSSPTRGIIFAGNNSSNSATNIIQYLTIASIGNSTDFGDALSVLRNAGGCSSETRGVVGGGAPGSGEQNVIQYITIASTGNATDFGDLSQSVAQLGACSSSVRGVFGGGEGSTQNTMDYVTIATTGNSSDFGDLTQNQYYLAGCSNAHGGLS